MSGLSYFTIQIQFWIFKIQSKSNHGPKSLNNIKIQVQIQSRKLTKYRFLTTKIMQFFSNPVLILNLRSYLQSGSNPNSTKFIIVRIQSNPSPVQCSSLMSTDRTGSDWIETEANFGRIRTGSDCIFFKLADQDWIGLRKILLL